MGLIVVYPQVSRCRHQDVRARLSALPDVKVNVENSGWPHKIII
jgi:hypothetical protein